MSKRTTLSGAGTAARELNSWFTSVATLVADAFSIDATPLGRASGLHLLRHSASLLLRSPLDDAGDSYKPLSLFLVAACRTLGVKLKASHWAAALEDVSHQEKVPAGTDLGLTLGRPSERFKLLLDDALEDAGLGTAPTPLDDENRHLALGLAVNWALRTLVAYAAEVGVPSDGAGAGRRDLPWMASLVKHTLPTARA